MPEYLQPLDNDEKVDPTDIHGLDKFANWGNEKNTPEGRVKKVLEIAIEMGSYPGEHHKAYVIDQMVRTLTGCPVVLLRNTSAHPKPIIVAAFGESDEYREFIKVHNSGENGPDTYKWDQGIAP